MCNIKEGAYRLCECGRYEGAPHLHIAGDDQKGPYFYVQDAIVTLYPRYAQKKITDTEMLLVGRAIFFTLPLKADSCQNDDQKDKIATEINNIKHQLRQYAGTELREMLDKIFGENLPPIQQKYNVEELVKKIIAVMRGTLTGLEELSPTSSSLI